VVVRLAALVELVLVMVLQVLALLATQSHLVQGVGAGVVTRIRRTL
jgi:hypothetical protein